MNIETGRRPEVGDVVQAGGKGRGMVVQNPEAFEGCWWKDEPDAVVCAWTEHGVTRDAVYLVDELQVVGAQRRRSDREIYEKMTEVAIETITIMALKRRHKEALGAFEMWRALAGPMACDSDALRMQQLVNRAEHSTTSDS